MPDMPLLPVVVEDVVEVDGIVEVVDEAPGDVVFMLPVVEPVVALVLPGFAGGIALVVVLGVVVFGEPVLVALPRVPAPELLAPVLLLAPPPWSPLPALPVDCAYERPMALTTKTVAIAEARDLRVFIRVTPEKVGIRFPPGMILRKFARVGHRGMSPQAVGGNRRPVAKTSMRSRS
jgi:hypothetical protein